MLSLQCCIVALLDDTVHFLSFFAEATLSDGEEMQMETRTVELYRENTEALPFLHRLSGYKELSNSERTKSAALQCHCLLVHWTLPF